MSLATLLWQSVLTLFMHLFAPAAIASSTLHFDDPAYAKWGQIAVKQAQSKYEASVVDYLHIGRYSISPTISEERFKLWLRKKGREFGVYVYVRFDSSSEELISVHFEQAR
ncbi:DUF3889 domain-containing protein [Paenibacillus physcomitrellae]|uniref:DUF3889 domain-containing protein n=1 Tax=Paenibacillus physcomitrellae TaxID=1619311 RepID=A0ABQ1FSB4_9BACL|nr:DUF3889 domain-containing protein [Paenibacillus physcomitrellae]GGA27645.1 hypothetical protein GCM10010917_10680 [Paenibacillus physcomitrellae]